MNDIELREKFEAIIPEGYVEQLRKLEELKVKFTIIDQKLKADMEEFLKANNLDSYEDDRLKITKTKDSTRKVVDTQKLKEEGLYEIYCKETPVKGSVKISIKYED